MLVTGLWLASYLYGPSRQFGIELYKNSLCMFTGLIPHSNHAAAAVMIVNPTTPNAVAGNISQPFNVSRLYLFFIPDYL